MKDRCKNTLYLVNANKHNDKMRSHLYCVGDILLNSTKHYLDCKLENGKENILQQEINPCDPFEKDIANGFIPSHVF